MNYEEEAFDACIECALWSTIVSDESGERNEPADDHFGQSDIAPEVLAEIRSDLHDFITANQADLEGLPAVRVGRDFWLTREGHGSGFWDRGLGERGERLSAAAKVYGSLHLGLWLGAAD